MKEKLGLVSNARKIVQFLYWVVLFMYIGENTRKKVQLLYWIVSGYVY